METEMIDEEKCVILARVMGWTMKLGSTESEGEVNVLIYDGDGEFVTRIFDFAGKSEETYFYNALNFGGQNFNGSGFYKLENMPLAKKVIAWGATEKQEFRTWLQEGGAYQTLVWDDGIRKALDALLELVTESSA